MNFRQRVAVFAFCLPGLFLSAQTKAPESWFTLDQTKNGVQGTGADEALAKLKAKGKKSQTIIVAVLDSGVDGKHEDLKDIMWTNPGETPGNNKDDDGNGYVDDIHGWNFLGGPNGESAVDENLELTREYARLSKKYGGSNGKNLSGGAKKEFEYYQGIKQDYEEARTKAESAKAQLESQFVKAEEAFAVIQKACGKTFFTPEDLAKMNPGSSEELKNAIAQSQKAMAKGLTPENIAQVKEAAAASPGKELKYSLNPDLDTRRIVGDDPNDLNYRFYGNNDTYGSFADHGTHVAGIIGAIRDNGVGVNGIADNVRIMSVRCVPNGDERDKDVANAIRYAVDNGASIINMSFGKNYSPHKSYVDEAVKYAAEHDVLLVHAAGNESNNNDLENRFPNDTYLKPVRKGLFKKEKNAPNWLEVGAVSWRTGEKRVPNFSNYGKKNVDLFAPGHQLYSTIPDNKYAAFSGTSMAAPAAVGVAAILRSYYPELSAEQVRGVMIQSVIKQDGEVYKPGTTEKVLFSALCASGGIASASNAVDLAAKTKPARKAKKATWRDAGLSKPVKKEKAVTP